MHECLETIIRILFLLLKFMWNHAILTLIIILIAVGLSKLKYIILGIIGWALNNFQDTFTTITFGAGWVTSALLGILLGIIWAIIVLNCKANNIVKIIAAPFFFALGIFWLAVPTFGISFIPVTLGLGFLLDLDYINYVILAIPFIIGLSLILQITPFLIFITPWLCDKLNFVLSLFA